MPPKAVNVAVAPIQISDDDATGLIVGPPTSIVKVSVLEQPMASKPIKL